MTGEVSIRLVVSGRVQVVGFRWFVARQARELPVRGWVRNLSDGRVEVLVAGPAAPVAQLEELVRRGPRFANVENVDKADVPHDMIDCKSFDIR
ncbi:MAG: acylphosphatase [Gemmatimonadales bacterium]|nr:acylphosphatase [Gemmatimonadales bacterium]